MRVLRLIRDALYIVFVVVVVLWVGVANCQLISEGY